MRILRESVERVARCRVDLGQEAADLVDQLSPMRRPVEVHTESEPIEVVLDEEAFVVRTSRPSWQDGVRVGSGVPAQVVC